MHKMAGIQVVRRAAVKNACVARQNRAFFRSSVSRLISNRFVAVCRGLAGFLALALLVGELFAADAQFHRAIHQGTQTANGGCVLCLFASGQVDLAQPSPGVSKPAYVCFPAELPAEVTPCVDFSYLSAPSRAPPSFPAFSLVVA